MKILTTIFLFGIIISGSLSPAEQRIVNKYSTFYGAQIKVEVVDTIVGNCGQGKLSKVWGCTSWLGNEPVRVRVLKNDPMFEWALIHEITHFTYKDKNEKNTDRRAQRMIDFVGSIL
jgi:hypothetical protein